MVQRVAGRRGWLPAQLSHAPVLVTGLLLLVGFSASARPRGTGLWQMQVVVHAPPQWFDVPGRAAAGILLLVAGFLLLLLASWHPPPGRLPLTVTRFPGFSLSALLLLLVAALTLFGLSGHSVAVAPGGVDWRFLAAWRSHPFDQVVGWVTLAGAAVSYAFSFAGPWHSLRVRGARGAAKAAACEPEA